MMKVLLDMSLFVWCTATDVTEKLAAEDSWTEVGGNRLLHMLYQPTWRNVLKDLNLYQCRCVNVTNTVV